MRIGVFGACREGVDCLRLLKAARICEDDFFCFLDNDPRVIGHRLESIDIYSPIVVGDLSLDLIVIAVIDSVKVKAQFVKLGFSGQITSFYGDDYYSSRSRQIGMAKIGSYSYFKPSTFLYNVEIGSYCHIGADCRLGLIGHDPGLLTTYPLKLKSLEFDFVNEGGNAKRLQPLIIEDDVYIGEGVSIMAGIRIGRGAIVGSKSFVSNDVPQYSVVAGVPSKIIAERLDVNKRKFLLESNWTELPIDEAIQVLNSYKA